VSTPRGDKDLQRRHGEALDKHQRLLLPDERQLSQEGLFHQEPGIFGKHGGIKALTPAAATQAEERKT